MQDFIKAYKAAIKFKLTKEQLSNFLEIKPKTLDRKRQKIQQDIGLTLPQLTSDKEAGVEIPLDTLTEFENELDENIKYFKSQSIQKKKRYVVTSAQMSTPINKDFLLTLELYCKENDAQLIVIPFRYNNPTSIWSTGSSKKEYIAPELTDYVLTEHVQITPMLHILGDTKIVPTAIQPIHGIDSLTGNASGIVGHPKVQLTTIPTPSKDLPKIMASTGTVTIPNYIPSKAGKRAEFHHSFSAIVVEIEDNNRGFHMRHMHYDDKDGMYDLDKLYTKKKSKKYGRVPILVMGDIHAVFIDKDVEAATLTNKDSICNVLKPEKIVLGDVHDGNAKNTHEWGNEIIEFGKHHFGRGNIQEELQISANFIDLTSSYTKDVYIVKSNHDEQIDRYLASYNPKSDPENAAFYYYMKYHQMKSVHINETGFSSFDPFEFWCRNPESGKGLQSKNVTFLTRDDTLHSFDYMLHYHGDKGPNGSRGSLKGLAKMGTPVIVGHSHSPAIYENSIQVGTSSRLDLSYAKGSPSSWLNSHCIIYPNSKATLINIIDGKWRI